MTIITQLFPVLQSLDTVTYAKNWLLDKALPLWATKGADTATGAFYERLNTDGSPDFKASTRIRVLARQIYVYAHAADMGWFPEGKQVALRGFD